MALFLEVEIKCFGNTFTQISEWIDENMDVKNYVKSRLNEIFDGYDPESVPKCKVSVFKPMGTDRVGVYPVYIDETISDVVEEFNLNNPN